MNIRITRITTLVLSMALLASQDAMAAKVYQWTDEEGVVHFSDVPPKDNASVEIQEINFVDYALDDSDSDKYSITNQLERMVEWRRQISEERLARKQLQLEAKKIAQERNSYRFNSASTPIYYPQPYYYVYPPYFTGFNKWHGHHMPGHHFGAGGPIQPKNHKAMVGARF